MSKPRKPKRSPAQWAAIGTIGAALIASFGLIIGEIIKKSTPPPTPTNTITQSYEIEYVGRILDGSTQKPIQNAKVSFEFRGAPSIVYTDAEGVYRLTLSIDQDKINGQVRIEAPSYDIYERFITIYRNAPNIEDIRLNLTPTQMPAPAQTVRADECVQPGDDWKCNCISLVNWQTFSEPSESFVQNDCWDLNKWGIAAEQGNLLIVAERIRGSTIQEQYVRRGILTPLPSSATISLDIVITILSSYYDQLTNLTIAIIPSNPIDLVSGVSIIYQKESTDSPIVIKFHERGSLQEYLPLSYSLNQKHHIEIETTAVSVSIYVDGSLVVGPEPLPLTPALWIGYLLPSSGEINATISSLSIVTK